MALYDDQNSDSDSADKSHAPTSQRLERARNEGDVVRSRDLQTFVMPAVMLTAALTVGPAAVRSWGDALLPFLSVPDMLAAVEAQPALHRTVLSAFGRSMLAVMPFWLGLTVCVLTVIRLQGPFIFNPDRLLPDFSRLSPLKALKNKFGLSGLFDFVKNLVMVALTLWAVLTVLKPPVASGAALVDMDPVRLPLLLGHTLVRILLAVALVTGTAGLIDYGFRYFQRAQRLRMTTQEIKKEMKENEGDPHFKGERRERGRKIALNVMLADVAKADVVITNPEHYAVALYWSRKTGSAPICVAKGTDDVAAAIRAAADKHGVPRHRDPPLARTLYAEVDIGDEIPEITYKAVAAAVRFAQEIRRRRKARGF